MFGVDLEKTIDAVSLTIFFTLFVKAISVIRRKRRINELLAIIDGTFFFVFMQALKDRLVL